MSHQKEVKAPTSVQFENGIAQKLEATHKTSYLDKFMKQHLAEIIQKLNGLEELPIMMQYRKIIDYAPWLVAYNIEETNDDEAHSKYIALVCKALTFTNDLIVSKMEGGHILSQEEMEYLLDFYQISKPNVIEIEESTDDVDDKYPNYTGNV